jgi:hypothetical protein
LIIEQIPDLDLIARLGQSTTPRSEGLHLSTIYGSLMKKLQPRRFNTGKPMDMVRIETGLVFENVLEQGLREKFATYRPGEIVSPEGIIMTPDGFNPTDCAGEEFKCTWMSLRPLKGCATPYTDEYGLPRDKFLHWFIQMKGYAKWLEVNRFNLWVLHINGEYDWKKPGGVDPQLVPTRIEFTQDEIDENWTMLINHARNEGMLK